MAGILGLVSTACDPLEDTMEELGDITPVIQGTTDYTLTAEDYEALLLENEYFTSVEEAEALLPAFLDDLYPTKGTGAIANIGYNVVDKLEPIIYTVSNDDYAELIENESIDESFLVSDSEISDFFSYKFPQEVEGSYVELTFNTVGSLIAYTLIDEDYDLVGNGAFDNFDIRPGNDEETIEARIAKISTILATNFSDPVKGQQYLVTYTVYDGSTYDLTIGLEYNGETYEEKSIEIDPAESYTLGDDDYEAIVSALSTKYPDATGSMDRFGNFERRDDEDAYWSDSMINEAITIVLDIEYPSSEIGDKFSVTYDIYDGSSGEETIGLQKLSDTEFGEIEPETITLTKTSLYALEGGEWASPYTFDEEDYTAMEQSFPNFSSEEEALYNISIYLGTQFPYAASGTFLPVVYDLFDDGETGPVYTNFEFDGDAWVGKPEIIETSVQYGKEDDGWKPDNTILYTLTTDDYAFAAAALLEVEGFEAAAGNLDSFGNFNRAGGSTNWTDEMVATALGLILDKNDPTAEVGQKYLITFAMYNGSTGTEEIKVIKDADGAWILNEE